MPDKEDEAPLTGPQSKVKKQNKWLEAFRDCGDEATATAVADTTDRTLYRWKLEPAFMLRYYDSKGPASESLEKGALRVIQWALLPENYSRALQYPTLILRGLERFKPEQWGRKYSIAGKEAQDVIGALLGLDAVPKPVEARKDVEVVDVPDLSPEVTKFLEGLDAPSN